MLRLHVEGFGSPMYGHDWFVCGPFRKTKKQAREDLRKLKAEFASLNQQVLSLTSQRDRLIHAIENSEGGWTVLDLSPEDFTNKEKPTK